MSSVTLHLYDLSRGIAKALSPSLLGKQIDGIWHTGVLVYGKEYFYGGGIQVMAPELVVSRYGMPPVQTIYLGETTVSKQELEAFLRSINHRFTAATYDLLRNNCNNFSNEVSTFLLGKGIPQFILDLPNEALSTPLGAALRPMLENMQREMNATGAQPFSIPFNDASLAGPSPFAVPPASTPAAAFVTPSPPATAALSRSFAVSGNPTLHLDKILRRIRTLNNEQKKWFTSEELASLDSLPGELSGRQVDLSKTVFDENQENTQRALVWWTAVRKLLEEGPASSVFFPALALFRVLLLFPTKSDEILQVKDACFDHLVRVTDVENQQLTPAQTVLVLSVLLNGFANPVTSQLVLDRAVQFLPFVFHCITDTSSQNHNIRVLGAKLIGNCSLAMKMEEELVITTLICGCAEVLDRLSRETTTSTMPTLEGIIMGIGRLLQDFEAARNLCIELGVVEVLRRLHAAPSLRQMQPLLTQVVSLI